MSPLCQRSAILEIIPWTQNAYTPLYQLGYKGALFAFKSERKSTKKTQPCVEIASEIEFNTRSGRLVGSRRATKGAELTAQAEDAILSRSLERGDPVSTQSWFCQRGATKRTLCLCSLIRLISCGIRAIGGNA